MVYKNGNVYEGAWKNGIWHGSAHLTREPRGPGAPGERRPGGLRGYGAFQKLLSRDERSPSATCRPMKMRCWGRLTG